jgi:hypothetical protein
MDMKPFTLLHFFQLIFLLVSTYGLNAQTIYVKSDALGANDGTTWENAFTDFSEALDSAFDGAELWVAGGVYHPGGSSPDVNSVFAVRQSISIYGGFAGTEVNLEDREPSVNLTVLSGDINEDDIDGDFTTNRSDNTRHVLYVDSLLGLVIIDGFTIKGGQTTDVSTLPLYLRAGGGIYGLSPVDVFNCRFIGNFARSGAGIFLTEGASNSSIISSVFYNNKNTDQGAGIYMLNLSDIVILNCSFTDNQTARGAVYPNNCRNVRVDNCFFQNNKNTTSNGGALFSFQNRDLVIRHCQFNQNSTAFNGGAIVINGDQLSTDSITNVRIEDCRFNENVSTFGGAILLFTCPDIRITKCEFRGDSAGNGGGAIYINQPENYITDTNDIRIDSCLFENNKAAGFGGGALFLRFTSAKVEHSLFEGNIAYGIDDNGGGHVLQNCPSEYVIYRDVSFNNGHSRDFGGAITAVGKNANYLFEFCHFSNNSSEAAGGAVDNNDGANFIYKHCMFNENVSMGRGGAMSLADDSTKVQIENSSFIGNEAANEGGAISSGFGSQIIEMKNCVLDSNRTLFEFGGAVSAGGKEAQSLFEFCQFSNNSCERAGGAMHTFNGAVATYKNCMFKLNVSRNRGGALSLGHDSTKVHIEHSTFTRNEAALDGGAISSAFASQIIEVENCVLDSNRTLLGFGGAISIIESGDDNIASLSIENSFFRFNRSFGQGGALNILDADAHITSSVFAENVCDDQGFGAAMSIKATNQDTVIANLINTTIVDNHGFQADGMGLGEEVGASTTATIQNCIFRNQGSTNYNYIFGQGLPEVISFDGNMSDDDSMIDILSFPEDLNQTSPLFNLDYSLMSNSPGIDAGVEGAPEFDILGNPRVNEPDMGAYENQMPVGIKENVLLDQDRLLVYPNPVSNQNPNGILTNAWRGDIKVQLSDLKGRIVFTDKFHKSDERHQFTLHMQNLNVGSYQLLVSDGQKSITGNIIKVQ